MRILIVSQYYYPENFCINEIASELVKRGHTVTVLTGLPNYPEGVIPKEYRHGQRRKEIVSGVNVIRCYEAARGHGNVRRVLNYLSFMCSVNHAARKLPTDAFDIIYGYAPSPILQMMGALEYKRRSGKPILFYCIDIWPEALKGSIRENSFPFKWAKKKSRMIFEACDSIQVTSKPFIQYIEKTHGIPAERIEYLPQHAEDMYLYEDYSAIDNGRCDFLFAGNIGTVQDMDCIVEACAQIGEASRPYNVHIVGDGSYLQATKALVRERGLEEIFVFHGRCPLEEMPTYYRMADACLLTLKHENEVGLTLPLKLQGYMAAGKPVIGAIDGAAKEIIEESGCGECVAAGDSQALAKVMRKFIEVPVEFESCGIRGREYFMEHFTKERFMDKLEQRLVDLAGVN